MLPVFPARRELTYVVNSHLPPLIRTALSASAAELRVELMYPADAAGAELLERLAKD